MRHLALTALALCLAANGGLAQDAPSEGPPGFDGFYVTLGLGASFGDGETDFPVLSGGTRIASFDPGTGSALGLSGGYNWRNGNIVYGADFQYLNFNNLTATEDPVNETREVLGVVDLRGRVGYATGDLLLYGALGWSWSRLHIHPGLAYGDQGRDNSADLNGVSIGVGAEYNFTERFFGAAEYTYRNLSGEFEETTTSNEIDVSTAVVRVGFRF